MIEFEINVAMICYIRFQKVCLMNIQFFMPNVPMCLLEGVWWEGISRDKCKVGTLMYTMVLFCSSFQE